jgi:lambda family phage portal protein
MTAILDNLGRPMLPARRRVAGGGRAMASLSGGMTPYDAADITGQEMASWNPWLGSPDTELNPYRDRVVSRIRDMVRNDGWASGTVTRLLDSVIGPGFRLVSKPDHRSLSRFDRGFDAVWADEFGQAVEARWRDWAEDPGRWNDTARRLSFGEQLRVAFRHKIVDGDALAVINWLPERVGPGRAEFATSVQLVDPDRLSNPQLQPDTVTLRGGVEIDGYGAAIAYHIRQAHQADWFDGARSVTWNRVPRETGWGRPIVIHDFDSDRADQHRAAGGVLTPVLARLKMLAKYDAVELQAAIVNAIFGAFIESPFDHTLLTEALQDGDQHSQKDIADYQGNRADFHDERRLSLGGVRIPTLYPGEKIGTVAANRPNTAFEFFEGAVLRNVAATVGIAEQQISQNWARTNFSSARAALLEAWKTIGRMRASFGRGYATPILGAVLEEAIDRRELPLPRRAPDFMLARAAYSRCRWMGPARGWVDPVKEKQGAVLGMDAGLSTLEHECAEQGLDWEEVIEPQWAGAEIPAEQDAAKPEPQ